MFAFLGYIIEHAYNWLLKLALLLAIDTVFRLSAAAWDLSGLSTFIIYFENLGIYKMFPEHSIVFVLNFMVLIMTWEILVWVFGRHHLPNSGHNTQQK